MQTASEKQQRKTARQERVLALVRAFPHQPDVARIPPAVIDALIGRSPPTRWRYIAQGRLPRPGTDGCFAAGDVRAALAKMGAA